MFCACLLQELRDALTREPLISLPRIPTLRSARRGAGRKLDTVISDCSALGYISGLGRHHVLLLAHELHGRGIRVLIAELPAVPYDILGQADYLGSLKTYPTMSDPRGSRA